MVLRAAGIYPLSKDVMNTASFKPSDLKAYQKYKDKNTTARRI